MNQELLFRQAVFSSTIKILEQGTQRSITAEEFDRQLGDLIWLGSADLSVGVLETLLSGGVLSVVEDESLRAEIAELRVWIHRTEQNEDLANARERRLEEFLLDRASLSQLNNASKQRPGGRVVDVPDETHLPTPESIDHRSLLEAQAFYGLVTQLNWSQTVLIQMYSLLKQRLLDLEERIEIAVR